MPGRNAGTGGRLPGDGRAATVLRLLAAAALAVVLATAAAAISSAHAAVPAAMALGPSEQADIARIESYLNSVTTVSSRFLQRSSTGQLAGGDFFLRRPGKMRIEYQPPVPVLIVADGRFLIYHDTQLQQVTYLPLGSTPAGILLAESISLSGAELTITEFDREPGALRVTVVRTRSPHEGSLTLVFSDSPLALRKWSVVDAQGTVTDVSLIDARFDEALDPDLFRFRDPRFFREWP
ncbi:MAG: outer membrane lipoprotein carrier protein LolA [Rhodospirillales bacterium]